MAKAPEKLVFSFDPRTSAVIGLSDEKFKIIWGCIKTGHIVDQYFNGHVQKLVDCLNDEMPGNYDQFKMMVGSSGLSTYGNKYEGGEYGYRTMDDEFWKCVFDYITGVKNLEIEIPSNA